MKSTRQNKTNTQLDKANKVLKELAVNVTTEDRLAARKKLKLSRYTIGYSLKGDAKDLDTATNLIRFFRQRIEDRDKEFSL